MGYLPYVGVRFSDNGVQSDAGANTIQNCEFIQTRYLHDVVRHATFMRYINNT